MRKVKSSSEPFSLVASMEWRWIGLLVLLLLLVASNAKQHGDKLKVCIVGGGIGGSSVAHFLRKYSRMPQAELQIHVYERNAIVGGRMAMVDLSGDRFEAGASILHPKNLHTLRFVNLLGLKKKTSSDPQSFGIWNGDQIFFQTRRGGKSSFSQMVTVWINNLSMLWRYGTRLFKMQAYVSRLLERFLHFYDDNRPPYTTVQDMLQSVELYEYTQHELYKELLREGLSEKLISELVTVITRINYGQSVNISGLAGAVSLCGSGDDLWAVEGGNWQMADGLIKRSKASLHLNGTVLSVSTKEEGYEVESLSGEARTCDAVVVATPLDEVNIRFDPPVEIPKRSMHHTFATFVRGLLNPAYFKLKSSPDLIATTEVPGLPFISISVLKTYGEEDKAYKVFSRSSLSDDFLDQIFTVRKDTIRYDWAAYPEYKSPEVFAPVVLDERHLYYVNSFENAASTMETSAVAAENVARLLLTRLLEKKTFSSGLALATEEEMTTKEL